MGGSLIRRVVSDASIGYGINIQEQLPPGRVSGLSSQVIGIVGDFPWGPVNTVTEINTPAELFATFCPAPFNAAGTYPAMDAFLNKSFPGSIRVVRIAPSSVVAAAAAKTYDDVAVGDSVTVTANYKGLLGNSISIAWVENADDATARDAVVTIGTAYSATYESVATIVAAALVVTDPSDPYVTFSKAVGATLVPAVAAAAALTAGADGTAVAVDYVGSGSSAVGIRKFYADSVDCNVLFVASCPSALIDSVNTGLKSFATDVDKGITVLCTPADQTEATAKTYVASYRDDRIFYPYPRVKTIDSYASTLPEITVDGNSFAAVAIASVDPWISPGGSTSAQYLTGITGLENEDISATSYDALNAKGIAPFQMVNAFGGACIRKALTTSLTSGLTKIRRRRSCDFFIGSIAERMQMFAEMPLDLSLSGRSYGPVTGSEIGEVKSFLQTHKDKFHLADYSVDGFGANTQDDIDSGRWIIAIAIDTFSDQDEIVLRASVGDGVVIVSE